MVEGFTGLRNGNGRKEALLYSISVCCRLLLKLESTSVAHGRGWLLPLIGTESFMVDYLIHITFFLIIIVDITLLLLLF